MRFICIYIWLIGLYISSYAQQPGGITPGADTAYISRLYHSGDKILNPDSAIVLCNEVLKLSIEANYADGAFSAIMSKGIKYYEKEDYEQERKCCMEALPWAAKSSQADAIAWCYDNIGDTYFNEGDYIRASENYYKALDELKKTPAAPTHTTANLYNALGQVNIRLGQRGKAMAYYDQAEDIARKGNLSFQLANTYTYKGEYYTRIHQTDSARRYFRDVLEIGRKINKPDLLAIGNDDLGKTYIDAGEYGRAISYLQSAISLAQNRFPYIVVDASYSLGDAWYHIRQYKDAEAILTSALQESIAHNYKDNYVNCYTKLIAVYKATGQYKKALDYTDTVAFLKDSLTSAEKATAINQMEIKYKTAEKDIQIARNQLLIAQQKNKITGKNIWIASIAGSVFLLSLIAVGLYRNSLNKQSLQAEQINSLQKENTIGILKGVVQGEENERSRIARELHDGIGGILSAAMMRFMTIRHENAAINDITAYREGMELLDEMGDEIRKTAHNLMPEALLKQNLPDALRAYCNNILAGGTIQIDFQCFGEFENIGQDFKLNVYRIVQELLKNMTQHAYASHALVQLIVHGPILAITVEDNGRGFDVNEIKNGIGLHNLKTRVLSLNGQYTLESEAGKGTTVFIEIPVEPEKVYETFS